MIMTGRANLRSAERHDMLDPSLGRQSFHVAAMHPQPSGMRFHRSSAHHHPVVVDSLELRSKPLFTPYQGCLTWLKKT